MAPEPKSSPRRRRIVAWVVGSPLSRGWLPLFARLALAAVFIPTGLGKFFHHDAYVVRFERWGIPAPGAAVVAVGVLEVACGIAALIGVVPRLTGILVAADMVGALATAGRVDGGMDVWLPLLMLALAITLVARGPGRGAVRPAWPGPVPAGRRGSG